MPVNSHYHHQPPTALTTSRQNVLNHQEKTKYDQIEKVRQYLSKTYLSTVIEQAVNDTISHFAEDTYGYLSVYFEKLASPCKVEVVTLGETLDSNGNPAFSVILTGRSRDNPQILGTANIGLAAYLSPEAVPITDSALFTSSKTPGTTQLEGLASKVNEAVNKIGPLIQSRLANQTLSTLSTADELLRSIQGINLESPYEKLIVQATSLACFNAILNWYPKGYQQFSTKKTKEGPFKLLVPLVKGNTRSRIRSIGLLVKVPSVSNRAQSIKKLCTSVLALQKQIGGMLGAKLQGCVVQSPSAGAKPGKDAKAKGGQIDVSAQLGEGGAYVLPPNVLVRLPLLSQWVRDAVEKTFIDDTFEVSLSIQFDGNAIADSLCQTENAAPTVELYTGDRTNVEDVVDIIAQVATENAQETVLENLVTKKSESIFMPLLKNKSLEHLLYIQDPQMEGNNRSINLKFSTFVSDEIKSINHNTSNIIFNGFPGDLDNAENLKLREKIGINVLRVGTPNRTEYFATYRQLQLE